MTEKNIVEETAKALGLKDLAPEIYKDLLQPATREVGKALLTTAKTVSIALAPLDAVNWGYQQSKQWLSAKVTQKLANIPVSEIQPPPMNIAGPAALNLYFSYDQEALRNMYAQLIASSMKKSTSGNVHPAFVSIIQQLLPGEAILLEVLYREAGSNIIGERNRSNYSGETNAVEWASNIIFEVCKKSNLVLELDFNSSLLNLMRLKLIDLESESEAEYVPEYGDSKGIYSPTVNLHITDSLAFTVLGNRFVRSCIEIENCR
ncbi:DUF4393 domain-containing protein [Rheinheimera sp. YQF-2]|uniref:DUF4393 domain-containing protein n=1 Tax=Rheinheimera lutimaris TaxID=2740584 RepID=A0A7Y5EJS0_9GAMM|nr:DUF4393 domain-containing protein [Rheinheimera lutimaris]NRQ41383.1 DUF4393 domain-containing protein [Rheinheimera lutimaris]